MNLNIKRDLDFIVGQPLIWFFIPFAKLLGFFLRRDHSADVKGDILFLKMAGGGSLVIAYPSLEAIKKSTEHKVVLLTTPGVAPFAETLNIFDEIIPLNDKGIFPFIFSYVKFVLKNFKRFDTVINYEVHSRFSTLISLFTLARNRIGFHRHEFKPYNNLNSHSCYFNITQSIPYSYDRVAKLLQAPLSDNLSLHKQFKENLFAKYPIEENHDTYYHSIGIGAVCSDLALERMMPLEYWKQFKTSRLKSIEKPIRIFLYGAPADKNYYDKMIKEVFVGENIEVHNLAGFKSLGKTITHMGTMLDEYWGIDTSLLHYARILGIPSHTFWGPTSPKHYLRPFDFLQEKNYDLSVECSPCVHFTRKPPCNGVNKCMYHKFE